MQYNNQKKMFYIQLFVGMVLIGYNAVKFIRKDYAIDSIDIPVALAVGFILPLSGYFGLRRARAQAAMKKQAEAGNQAQEVQ